MGISTTEPPSLNWWVWIPRIFWECHEHQGPIKKWPSRSIRPPGSGWSEQMDPKFGRNQRIFMVGKIPSLKLTANLWGSSWVTLNHGNPMDTVIGMFKKNNGRHQRILTKEKMWGSKNSAGAGWIFWGSGRFSDSVIRSHEVSKGSPWKNNTGVIKLVFVELVIFYGFYLLDSSLFFMTIWGTCFFSHSFQPP